MLQEAVPHYEIRAFGRLEVTDRGAAVALRPAHRRLLTILLTAPGNGLARDVLIDRMWADEPPRSARNTLQVHVSAIRSLLPGLVLTTPDGYRLDLGGHRVDLDDFFRHEQASRDAADVGDWERAVASCDAALELFAAPPLQAVADDEFARPEVARLTEMRLEMLERWAQGMIALGRAEYAVPELEKLVVAHPLRERFWEHLMVGRYRLGRQADALRAYREVASVLGRELGIEPGPRLRRIEEDILMQSPAIGEDDGPPATNLPLPTTTFVGRDDASDEVDDLLESSRLLTITGPPGVGKSRLAVEVGRRRLDRYRDGVWLVDLSGATSPSDVSAAIAATLGAVANVSDLHQLAGALAGLDALLILDECSHVRRAVGRFVAGLEANGAALRLLATSRRRLSLDGESVYPLPPLQVPGSTADDAALSAPAVRLLLDRMPDVNPRLHLGDDAASVLVELCRWSDGIPLAVELAAHWVHTMGSPGEAPPMHARVEPLRSALDASYEYIAASDREVLLAASVFAGPVPIEAVAGVWAGVATGRELAGVMARLVESSLMRTEIDDTGESSYTMLHPVREYCRSRLSAADREELTRRHASWFASRSDALAVMPHGRVGRLMPDIRAAVRTLIDRREVVDAARLAVAVRGYWDAVYLTWEASEWLESVLGSSDRDEVEIDAVVAAAWAAYLNHDYPLARDRYRLALELARDRGDVRAEATALFGLGRIATPIAPPEAESLLEDALERFRTTGSPRDRAACLLVLGIGLAWRGAVAEARPRLEESLATLGDGGDPELESVCHRYLSLCSWYDGDLDAADREVALAETIARDAADVRRRSGALLQRALVDVARGDVESAAAAALDALAPIPAAAAIDLALVCFGAVPVLVEYGEEVLAGELFSIIDDVFSAHGWMRIDLRSPLAAALRAKVPEATAPRPVAEVRRELAATLERIAGR